MKATNKLSKRKAISPVIATVILVAVAITVAVGVSYWMSGIAGQYTSFEKVEIQSGYSSLSAAVNAKWYITLELKNTGSATANLINVFVNDVPVVEYDIAGDAAGDVLTVDNTGTSISSTAGLPIASGKAATVYVYIGSTLFSSGTTINIKIHSAGGMDYIKLIKLI